MNRATTYKFLYLVAIFSFLTLSCTLLTLKYSLPLLMHSISHLLGALLFVMMQLVLIIAPFTKENRCLFLMVPIAYMSSYINSLIYFLGFLFTNQNHYITMGIVPGWLSDLLFIMFDTIGLAVLIIRCFGYLKERRQGLKARF